MKTILVIEDDMVQQKALSDALSVQFRVLTALDGKIGWNIIVKEHPDLILLDIMLPGGINGFDLLSQLKMDPAVSNTPVVVLTNLDTEETTARKIGVADYLIKSNTSIDTIVTKVNALLTP